MPTQCHDMPELQPRGHGAHPKGSTVPAQGMACRIKARGHGARPEGSPPYPHKAMTRPREHRARPEGSPPCPRKVKSARHESTSRGVAARAGGFRVWDKPQSP